MKESLLYRLLERIRTLFTNTVVGWIWAGNSAASLVVFKLTGNTGEAWLAIFCFLVAVLFWNRADMEIKK